MLLLGVALLEGCASRSSSAALESEPVATWIAPATTQPGADALEGSEPAPSAEGQEVTSKPTVRFEGPLGPFWEKLHALGERREQSVRILWLGDSHTAADFMTDATRRVLTDRYGDAGPGFVRVGVPAYRHGRARSENQGTWRRFPQQPSRRSQVLDGVFGPCGMRAVPEPGASARVLLRESESRGEEVVRITLLYRLPGASALEVGWRGQRALLTPEGGSPPFGSIESSAGSPIQRFVFEGSARDEIRIEQRAGAPEVFGLYFDTVAPGVLLDTCGIDGARAATVLAWDAAPWQAEIQARSPDLVVLAYGTNEVFDGTTVARYQEATRQVIELLRGASPSSACLVMGPPDAEDASGRVAGRVEEITEAGRRVAEELACGFASGRELMGGKGSFGAWQKASPALAQRDGVHLSSRGYAKLGALLAELLLPPAERNQEGSERPPGNRVP